MQAHGSVVQANGEIYLRISSELKGTPAEKQIINEVLEHYK
jgi:hypothetical protein